MVDGLSGETGPNVPQLVEREFIQDSAFVSILLQETVDDSVRVLTKA